MLAELIMAQYGWEVWSSPIPPDNDVRKRGEWKPWDVFRDGFLVGVWTGPDRDLLCVKPCATNEEAELWLAPSGPTILLATLRSVAKLLTTTLAPVVPTPVKVARRRSKARKPTRTSAAKKASRGRGSRSSAKSKR